MTTAAPLLFPDVRPANRHPARYHDSLLPVLAQALRGCQRVLDPFAGTGKVFNLAPLLPGCRIFSSELEWEWAAWRPGRMAVGNALSLPFADGTFDAICVSPAYGNRMADHCKYTVKTYFRNTYQERLGRDLHRDNAGALQWGEAYRQFHRRAWHEARRVLAPGGLFVLNCKNHIRDGHEQYVTQWHIGCLVAMGFTWLDHIHIPVPGLRAGANREARVGYESVVTLRREP